MLVARRESGGESAQRLTGKAESLAEGVESRLNTGLGLLDLSGYPGTTDLEPCGGSVHKNVSIKSSYDVDLVLVEGEGAPDPVRGEPRTGRPTGCLTKPGPTARWYVACMSIWIYVYAQMSPSICIVYRFHPQSAW